MTNGILAVFQSPPMGFTAVNTRQSVPADTMSDTPAKSPAEPLFSRANTENVTVLNGASIKGISQEQRVELIKSFLVNADIQARDDLNQRSSISTTTTRSATLQAPHQTRAESLAQGSPYTPNTTSAVPIPSTPAALLPYLKPSQLERDDGGPYKAEMVNRMESLHRGERILPPCDRCRRLHMDCLKNLTACMGCTKKHAKCSWKDVREEELRANQSATPTESYSPEVGDGPNDQAELGTPDASASSHHSPSITMQQPTHPEPPPPTSATSKRELDLLPPLPPSRATALTTSAASPSIYASVERKSERFPSPSTNKSSTSTPKLPPFDRAPPPPPPPPHRTTSTCAPATPASTITQQLQDAANSLAAAHRSVFHPSRHHKPSRHNNQISGGQASERNRGHDEGEYGNHGKDGDDDDDGGDDDDDDDEGNGDRLQALAAQVYRSTTAAAAQQQQQQGRDGGGLI